MHTFLSVHPSARAWKYSRRCLSVMGPGGLDEGYSIPSAEAADDPGGPGEGVFWMRVFLQFGFTFELGVEGVESFDLTGIEGERCGLAAMTVARLQELDGDRRRLGGDGGELDEAVGGFELAVFDFESLDFQHAEQLLDAPACLVPIDDAPRRAGVGERVRGEQTPVD